MRTALPCQVPNSNAAAIKAAPIAAADGTRSRPESIRDFTPSDIFNMRAASNSRENGSESYHYVSRAVVNGISEWYFTNSRITESQCSKNVKAISYQPRAEASVDAAKVKVARTVERRINQ